MEIDSKLPTVGNSIFSVMSQLAADTGAINLSQGFPSFNPPDALLERIDFHMKNGANQYAPMPGVPALRAAIAAQSQRLHQRNVDADTEVTICSGATEGLFSAIQTIVRRDDEVIVFDPAYDAYEPAITLAGGVTRHVPMGIAENGFDFEIDWQPLIDAINDKTRLLICNFPHNPTGALLSHADLDRLAGILRNTHAFLLADDVYEHIIFDGKTHCSLAGHDELWERSFIVSSFGKTYHATGWRTGYCLAPRALTTEFRRIHQYTVFSANTPVQLALADFLGSDPGFADSLSDFYQKKRDYFCALLDGSRFKFSPALSTFFQILDYSDISDEHDEQLAKRWTRDIGVAAIPVSVFCETPALAGRRLRFCFAKDDATLAAAAERLQAL